MRRCCQLGASQIGLSCKAGLGIARCPARCHLVPIGNQSRSLQLATKLPNGPLQLLVRHGPIVGPVLLTILGEPEDGLQMTEGGIASPA